MKAMSNGTSLSLPKHFTQGSLAKVVIPEKTESAVTDRSFRRLESICVARARTIVVSGEELRLIWEPDIVQRNLVVIVAIVSHAERGYKGEESEKGKFGHLRRVL